MSSGTLHPPLDPVEEPAQAPRKRSSKVGLAGRVWVLSLCVMWFGDPSLPAVEFTVGAAGLALACGLVIFEEVTYRFKNSGRALFLRWTYQLVVPMIGMTALSAVVSGPGTNASNISLRILWFLIVVPCGYLLYVRSLSLVKWTLALLATRSVVGIIAFLLTDSGPRLRILELGGDNILAQLWVFALIGTLLLRRRTRSSEFSPLFAAVLWPIGTLSIVLSSSRGGLLLLILAATIAVLVKVERNEKSQKLKLGLFLSAAAITGYLVVLAVAPASLERYQLISPGAGAGDKARSAIVQEAWDGSMDRFWLGNGPGAVDFANPAAVREWNTTGRTFSAHNSLLQLSYDFGVPFAVYFWASILWMLGRLSRHRWAFLLPLIAACLLETAFLVLNAAPVLGLYMYALVGMRRPLRSTKRRAQDSAIRQVGAGVGREGDLESAL